MSITRRTIAACTVLACTLAARADDHGKLLIIGGGMTQSMAPIIYGVLADQMPEHGTLGFLPTAGEAVAKEDPAKPNRLAANLKGRQYKDINLMTAAQADDPEIAKQIAACDAVFFGGGAQSRIVKAFHPDGKDTLASKAVDAVLARGGLVAGTSAGAEIMTDPMIMMGDSDKALADPASLPIDRGMGYFPFGMVDQHFLQRGRFGRLVVALERTQRNYGFGISEARAMLVDRESGKLTGIGADAIIFIDRSHADGRHNLRVNVLSTGDTVDGRTGVVTVSSKRPSQDLGPREGAEPDVSDAWAKLAIEKLIHSLLDGKHKTATALDPHAEFKFSIDPQTKLYGGGHDELTLLNLRLDIEKR